MIKYFIFSFILISSGNLFAQDLVLDELFSDDGSNSSEGIEVITDKIQVIDGMGVLLRFNNKTGFVSNFAKMSKLTKRLIIGGFVLIAIDGVIRLAIIEKGDIYSECNQSLPILAYSGEEAYLAYELLVSSFENSDQDISFEELERLAGQL